MARDLFHNNVREALLKEGWIITDDSLRVPIDGTHLEIDRQYLDYKSALEDFDPQRIVF